MIPLKYIQRFFIATALLCCILPAQAQRQELFDWRFSQAGQTQSYPAIVSGTVHTDLLANGLIPDPFQGSNETAVAWVDSCAWVYQTQYQVDKKTLQAKKIELVFEGLDTYADIYVNDVRVLQANNMFRTWRKDVKEYLKAGTNQIRVVFFPALLKIKEHDPMHYLTLQEEPRVFARKAQYHFGWDWGPKFVTAGIWKPVYLQIYANEPFFEELSLKQQGLTENQGNVTISVSAYLPKPKAKYQIVVQTNAGDREIKQIIDIPSTQQSAQTTLNIPNPMLWYPNGMGRAHLYYFEISLLENGKVKASTTKSLGFRTIEVIQQADAKGRSFMFKVNRQPLFIKGANWIPAHSFLPQISKTKYETLIQMAKESHFNMLRVWGGGIYESEDFYDACDRNGILVWQDFPFACALYPADPAFLENVAQEATEQIKRISQHTSLALWCGNNENNEGWHNWGWQKRFGADTAKAWNNYQKLFHQLLPKLLQTHDPERDYHPSSPEFGWGRKESMHSGDSHYWGVWWGLEPFDMYKKKTGRFMSEYGFQGMPSLQSIDQYIPKAAQYLVSPALQTHQKHPTGYQNINTYMAREYQVPQNLEDYVYVSQLLQAYGMKTAIEAHRRAKPYCMGTLYWQFNDCWPVTSWSGIDYYGRWKAFQYFTKKAYRETIVSVNQNGDTTQVWLITDAQKDITGVLHTSIQDFSGKILEQKDSTLTLKANESRQVYHFATNKQVSDTVKQFLYASFAGSETMHYFCAPKNLRLSQPTFAVSLESSEQGSFLSITPDRLAKNAYITVNGKDLGLEDNYMDLLPKRVIRLKLPEKVTDTDQIKIQTFTP